MDGPDAPDDAPPGRRDRAGIAALYVVAVVVYAVLGHRLPVPMVSPDEYTYGQIAQSIAHGDGISWRGEPVALRSVLYMVAIAPSWIAGSTVSGYAIAKVLGAAMVCSVVFPTWLLARRIVSARLALLSAALVVAGPSLVVAGGILTENLAYPLATWALLATVLALRVPGSRWAWAALAFALLAAAARAQLVVLVPIIALAVLAEAARHGGQWRAKLSDHRVLLAGAGGLSAAGLAVALLAKSAALGSYAGLDVSSPLSRIATDAGHQLAGLVTSAGIVPAIVVLAVSVRRAAWRDASLGPLLAVLWPATVVIVLESAVAAAGYGTSWHIERYVVYLLPLAFVVTVAALAHRLVAWRPAILATLVVAGGLLLAPGLREAEEELATYSITHLGDTLLGLSGHASLVLAAILSGAAVTAAVYSGGSATPSHRPAILAGSLVALLAVLSGPAWAWKTDIARGWRGVFPANLAWTDDQAGPPMARLIGAANASVFEVGDFFNRDAGPTFVPQTPIGGRAVRGRACVWTAGADGTLSFAAGCGAPPRRFYLDDYYAKFTFYDQRVDVDRPPVARIVTVPGTPRLRAELFPLCGPPLPALAADGSSPAVGPRRRPCEAPRVGGRLWLDRPATLELVWRGGVSDEQLSSGQQTYALPAGRVTTIRLKAPAGAAGFALQPGWSGGTPPQVPSLVAARLVDRSGTTNLLY